MGKTHWCTRVTYWLYTTSISHWQFPYVAKAGHIMGNSTMMMGANHPKLILFSNHQLAYGCTICGLIHIFTCPCGMFISSSCWSVLMLSFVGLSDRRPCVFHNGQLRFLVNHVCLRIAKQRSVVGSLTNEFCVMTSVIQPIEIQGKQ